MQLALVTILSAFVCTIATIYTGPHIEKKHGCPGQIPAVHHFVNEEAEVIFVLNLVLDWINPLALKCSMQKCRIQVLTDMQHITKPKEEDYANFDHSHLHSFRILSISISLEIVIVSAVGECLRDAVSHSPDLHNYTTCIVEGVRLVQTFGCLVPLFGISLWYLVLVERGTKARATIRSEQAQTAGRTLIDFIMLLLKNLFRNTSLFKETVNFLVSQISMRSIEFTEALFFDLHCFVILEMDVDWHNSAMWSLSFHFVSQFFGGQRGIF